MKCKNNSTYDKYDFAQISVEHYLGKMLKVFQDNFLIYVNFLNFFQNDQKCITHTN